MKILVLNGSPRPEGSTARMCRAFEEETLAKGHNVVQVDVCMKHINGCLACEACHKDKSRKCIQDDDMQAIYPILDDAEMLVIASPIYYHTYSGQMQCALNRIYALDKPLNLKKSALFLSAGSEGTFDGAVYAYNGNFTDYLKTEDMGVFTASEKGGNIETALDAIREMAMNL